MLTLKEVNKVRTMYYEQNYNATQIARIMKISRQTVYKYLKFVDFSDEVTQKKSKSEVEQYREDILKFLNYDRLHHHKQRHTGRKVYDRLKELYPNYDISYSATVKFFSRVKKEFYYKHNGYLPLDHRPGEAQVDLGDCSFIENGEKTYGKYLVLTFAHSNASYVQLVRHKNAESIVEAIKHIFEYLNGVPHTIWFDNDSALVKIINLENGSISRTLSDTFQRFKLHYEFKEVFMNPERGYEKGTVEQAVRFMRRNLLVPLPEFSDFDLYNKELLKRSSELLKREHYVLKQPIVDLHFEDINELNQLPPTSFVCTSVSSRKLDNYGRLTTENRHYYYLDPALAYERVQVKYLPNQLEIYYEEGTHIMTIPRISGKPGLRYINWSPYIRLLADKPAAMYNFSFLDLFEGKDAIIEKITKLEATKLQAFLYSFANMIDDIGIDEAVKKVSSLL